MQIESLSDFFGATKTESGTFYREKRTHNRNPKIKKFEFEGKLLTAWELAQDPRNVHKILPKGLYARCLRGEHKNGADWLFLNPKISKGTRYTLTTGEVMTIGMIRTDPRNIHKRPNSTIAWRLSENILDPEKLWR
jgi:hypothetical protein